MVIRLNRNRCQYCRFKKCLAVGMSRDCKFIQSSRQEGVFDDNSSCFSSKPYVVTHHLNRLIETVQMRGHNICFHVELTKIIHNYHQILPLI